jgi:hypothetical protein
MSGEVQNFSGTLGQRNAMTQSLTSVRIDTVVDHFPNAP